jgi:hypothetical protein
MAFRSLAQARKLLGRPTSPLTEAQKAEFKAATDFSAIPERVKPAAPARKPLFTPARPRRK